MLCKKKCSSAPFLLKALYYYVILIWHFFSKLFKNNFKHWSFGSRAVINVRYIYCCNVSFIKKLPELKILRKLIENLIKSVVLIFSVILYLKQNKFDHPKIIASMLLNRFQRTMHPFSIFYWLIRMHSIVDLKKCLPLLWILLKFFRQLNILLMIFF